MRISIFLRFLGVAFALLVIPAFAAAQQSIKCEANKLMQVADRLAEFPEVDYVIITAGSYDILIETVSEDNEALLRFLAERLRAIDGVRETETFVYLRMVKQTYQWGTR